MRWIALALVAAACGGRAERAPAPAPAPGVVDAAPTPIAVPYVAPRPLAELFGARPAIPAPVAALRFGMTHAEAASALPALVTPAGLSVPEHPGVTFRATPMAVGGLRVLSIVLPAEGTREVIEKAWGAPRTARDQLLWYDAQAGLRATLRPPRDGKVVLELERYQPIAKLLLAKGRFAFESSQRQLYGATRDELRAAYPDILDERVLDDASLMMLPALPVELGSTVQVELRFTEARVTSVTFAISWRDDPTFRDEILAAVRAVWGKPVVVERGKAISTYAIDPVVRVDDARAAMQVRISVTAP